MCRRRCELSYKNMLLNSGTAGVGGRPDIALPVSKADMTCWVVCKEEPHNLRCFRSLSPAPPHLANAHIALWRHPTLYFARIRRATASTPSHSLKIVVDPQLQLSALPSSSSPTPWPSRRPPAAHRRVHVQVICSAPPGLFARLRIYCREPAF